jgi:hypothetical protein
LDACLHGPSCDYFIANGCASAATPPPDLRLSDLDETSNGIMMSGFGYQSLRLLQKLNKQLAHLFWLLLLQPVTGSVYKVDAAHLCARGILHGLE